MALPSFDDVKKNFEERDFTRGRSYQSEGRVRFVRVEDEGARLVAEVKGTDKLPYEVEISVVDRGGRFEITADCTCPVGYMCKHAVAALLEAISQENRRKEKIGAARGGVAKPKSTLPAGLSGAVSLWLKEFETAPEAEASPDIEERVVYMIALTAQGPRTETTVTPAVIYKLKNGGWSRPKAQSFHQILGVDRYRPFLSEEDRAIFRLIDTSASPSGTFAGAWRAPADPDLVDLFLRRALATGRAFFEADPFAPLRQGPDLNATLSWGLKDGGKQQAVLAPERANLILLSASSPWYIDHETREAGRLITPLSPTKLLRFLDAPALTEKEAEILRARAAKTKLAIPAPFRVTKDVGAAGKLTAQLHVKLLAPPMEGRAGDPVTPLSAAAWLSFLYEGISVDPSDPATHYQKVAKEQIFLRARDKAREEKLWGILKEHGLAPAVEILGPAFMTGAGFGLPLVPSLQSDPWFWLAFAHEVVPVLERQGFKVTLDPSLESEIIEPDDDDIDATMTQSGDWWFDLDLGISVGGVRVPLLPVLVAFLQRLHSPADIDRLAAEGKCYAPLPDGRHVALPAARVKTILRTLIELFGEKPLDDKGQMKVSMDLVAALVKIEAITHKRWLGEGQLRALVEKLNDFKGIRKAPMPDGLHAELRAYQQDGYNWLHFLGDYGLGGILADDMGLGKTIQTLSYILSIKEAGKLTHPALVVMPTSLVSNWQSESARFTPALKVLTLHGKTRATQRSKIGGSDLVLTTYPLVTRDIEILRKQKWGLIILDEAQAIKNPSAKMTQAVCELEAGQRLCLTGTPVENHLGEAWSLFTFLMPGLLGDHRSFARSYRNPIEKHGDADRQELLAKRLKPFILRRIKSDVAKELPPKTEMVRRVTLADDQRDLYEAVRHVMNDRVREEIAAKGLARSQIVILDALLKLRQVCCDPRLVKLSAASKVQSSAKLEELMSMLPTLIEDGRRVLLFSQFTSMLDLIKPALAEVNIPFVELRGSTKDRRTPVEQFQNCEVPLFLISLKAGGTGLNLTAADTVIHYDPWWNPSVENQATDRAHRIGQDKPVFVYKLIAEGTVEERILELQHRKAELAGALFGDNPASAAALSTDDIHWLLG